MVTIRVWEGCTVRGVFSVSPGASSWMGAVGGAANSAPVDIDIDPWANLVVDRRVEHPVPVSIREEPEQMGDDDDPS